MLVMEIKDKEDNILLIGDLTKISLNKLLNIEPLTVNSFNIDTNTSLKAILKQCKYSYDLDNIIIL